MGQPGTARICIARISCSHACVRHRQVRGAVAIFDPDGRLEGVRLVKLRPFETAQELMMKIAFCHNGRCLQAKVSSRQGAFHIVVLDQGQPASKPLVVSSAMVRNPAEAAELMISLVKNNLCELSSMNTNSLA
ncbi:hypothetical protein [Dankookia sp. GCM10030260]|uniref:hypothetical protein n=1 Tax=Dankookia sp. GCM10030260 TaxID=3273390 RepID=UPI0036D3BE0F